MSRRDLLLNGSKKSKIPSMLLINKDSTGTSNVIGAKRDVVEPSPVLARLRAFLPEIAAANNCLTAASCSSDFDIVRMDEREGDGEASETDSTSDSETEEAAPHVEIDLSLFKNESSSSSDFSSSDDDGEKSKTEKECNPIPKAFEESVVPKKPKKQRLKRNLIEEVKSSDVQSGTKGSERLS